MRKAVLCLLMLLAFRLPATAATLKEDTAVSLTLWLFNTADSTPKTGVTVTTITVRYVKSDGTTASFSPTASGGSNDMVEKGNGAYYQEFTAAQLDTAGPFDVGCSVSGGVCAATVYDIVPASSYALCCEGNVASSSDHWNLATASVTAGIGLQIKTNLDRPVSTSSVWRNPTTIATLASQTSFTLTDGSADNDAYKDWVILITDSTSPLQMARAVVSAYTGSTKTITLRTDPAVFTMAVGDSVLLAPDPSLKPTVDFRPVDITSTGAAGVDWANVEAPTTSVTLSGTTVGTATNLTNLPTIPANWLTAAGTAADFSTEIQTGLLTIPKNTAYNNFSFRMYSSTTGLPLAGLTVTCQMSKDGAALASCTNAVTETGSGLYKTNLAAGDLNVTSESYFIFTATGARPTDFKLTVNK